MFGSVSMTTPSWARQGLLNKELIMLTLFVFNFSCEVAFFLCSFLFLLQWVTLLLSSLYIQLWNWHKQDALSECVRGTCNWTFLASLAILDLWCWTLEVCCHSNTIIKKGITVLSDCGCGSLWNMWVLWKHKSCQSHFQLTLSVCVCFCAYVCVLCHKVVDLSAGLKSGH